MNISNFYKDEFSEIMWELSELFPNVPEDLRVRAVELSEIFKSCCHQLGNFDGEKLAEIAWETSYREVDYRDTYANASRIIRELLK